MIRDSDSPQTLYDEERSIDFGQVLEVPSCEREFLHAKAWLQKCSSITGDNLYDHLTDTLNKILAERPENVVDFFEEYSKRVKEKRFHPYTDHLEDIYIPAERIETAKSTMPLLLPIKEEEPTTQDPEDRQMADMRKNNLLELLYYSEQAGIGLPKTEMYYINLSMKHLIRKEPIAKIRFWGKIFGIEKNYIIVECTLKDEEYIKRNEKFQLDIEVLPPSADTLQKHLESIAKEQELSGEQEKVKPWPPYPPLPINNYEPLQEPPSEPSGVGANKYVYYVCNEPGESWIALPDVTPKQIRIARKISKAFTGNLEQVICTYPIFPGKEINYLRAQIARISAGTQISPLGYYTFGGVGGEGGEEEEEAAGGGTRTEYVENLKYDPVALKDLGDKSMMFWVHHTLHILPQGRTSWWNPNPLPEQGEEAGEGEEEEAIPIAGPEPETGPALLTPCSEDVSIEAIPSWTVRISSTIANEYAIVTARSNFWPGSYAFATQGKIFQNIYFGNGLKICAPNFSLSPLPDVEQDYPLGPEIMEILDPTGAEEEAWRIAHLPKPKIIPALKGEGEGEEGEGEEDEDEY